MNMQLQISSSSEEQISYISAQIAQANQIPVPWSDEMVAEVDGLYQQLNQLKEDRRPRFAEG